MRTLSSSASACARALRSPNRPGLRSTAASKSTPISRPARQISSPKPRSRSNARPPEHWPGHPGTSKKIALRRSPMAIKYGRPIEPRLRAVEAEAPARTQPLELTTRLRRNRKSEWARRMVRENVLTADDLIWPLFIVDGAKARVPIASMPGVERLSVDQAVREAIRAAELDIPCIALFPYTDPKLRDEAGREALNPGNLGCQGIRGIKKEVAGKRIL